MILYPTPNCRQLSFPWRRYLQPTIHVSFKCYGFICIFLLECNDFQSAFFSFANRSCLAFPAVVLETQLCNECITFSIECFCDLDTGPRVATAPSSPVRPSTVPGPSTSPQSSQPASVDFTPSDPEALLSVAPRRGKWSDREKALLRRAHSIYGNHWTLIRQNHLPHRSGAQIKDKWRNLMK